MSTAGVEAYKTATAAIVDAATGGDGRMLADAMLTMTEAELAGLAMAAVSIAAEACLTEISEHGHGAALEYVVRAQTNVMARPD